MEQILEKIKMTVWAVILVLATGAAIPLPALAQNLTGQKELHTDLVWAENNGENYQIYYSRYKGADWEEKIPLTENEWMNTTPTIGTGTDGRVWAVWSTISDEGTDLYYSVFEINEWSSPEKIPSPFSSNTSPSIVVDDNNIPWLVWAGFDGQDDDIFVSQWDGAAWTVPLRINHDNTTPDTLPVIWKDRDGTIRVQWAGYGDHGIQNMVTEWAGGVWSDEVAETGDAYRAFLDTAAAAMPDLPEFVRSPELSTVCLQVNGGKNAFRFRDMGSAPQEKVSSLPKSAQPEAGEDIIIAFGDSITQGIPYITYNGDGRRVGGYEPYLEARTLGVGWPTQVLNYGVSGETSMEGFSRLSSVLNLHPARYVLLLEGTNDPIFGISSHSTLKYLKGMIVICLQHQISPIIATLPPDTKENSGKNLLVDYNPQIAELAHSKNVLLSDQYSALVGNWNSLTADGRHPNNAGYKIMADTWFNTLPKTTVTTLNATDGTITSAVLNGQVNPQGIMTIAYFEYGVDASFGHQTEKVNVGTGFDNVPLSVTVEDLEKDTTYVFRLVATNAYGTLIGETLAFKTGKSHSSGGCFINALSF